MQFGVLTFLTDYTLKPAEMAVAMEERGLEIFMVPEHTHIPTSRETPFPPGGDIPREYLHTLDPFVALTAAAAVTERLLIGTGISLVVQHDPIVLAKQVATLDFVSNGRFVFGIGGGWNREEMRNHGSAFESRFRLMRERIEAMKAIWTEEKASYHGKFVDFDDIWQYPKPVQKPYPPILIGGDAERTLERVVRYGDEWMPVGFIQPERFVSRVAELQKLAAAAGRGRIPVGVYGCPEEPTVLDVFIKAGAERLLFWLPSCGYDKAMGHLDRYAGVVTDIKA